MINDVDADIDVGYDYTIHTKNQSGKDDDALLIVVIILAILFAASIIGMIVFFFCFKRYITVKPQELYHCNSRSFQEEGGSS